MSEESSPIYQMSVPGTWSKSFETRSVTVFETHAGGPPEVVAEGTCRLRHLGGEPVDVAVQGFRPGHDWDKLSNDMGPGEWVCTPHRTEG